ncbi:MAG: response regulator [Candidatus Omnitrophota bacterium]|nr:response regulator [Candidatus Omnitrophota bacterium]
MAGKKVLIVDDEIDFVAVLRTRLEANNFEVAVAYDGEEGLEKVKEVAPDIIILDIMMPKINGFDVCRKLKLDHNYKDIPVIMLTAKFQASDIKFGQAVGVNAYITKPFEPQVLLDKMRELLQKNK